VEEATDNRANISQDAHKTDTADVLRIRSIPPGVVVVIPRLNLYAVTVSRTGDAQSVVIALNSAGDRRRGSRFTVDGEEVAIGVPLEAIARVPEQRRASELAEFLRRNRPAEVESILLRMPRGTMGFVELVCRAIDAVAVREEAKAAEAEGREEREPTEKANPVELVHAMICEGLGRAMDRLRGAGVMAYKMTAEGLRVGVVLQGKPSEQAVESLGARMVDEGPTADAEGSIREVVEELEEGRGPFAPKGDKGNEN